MDTVDQWMPTKAAHLIVLGLKEVGKPYVWGSTGSLSGPLQAYDCSEFVKNLLARVGIREVVNSSGIVTPITEFDPSWRQWERSRTIPLADGIGTAGALLFCRSPIAYPRNPHHIGHVAISLGNGYVLEARGRAFGVVVSRVRKSLNLATKVDSLYGAACVSPPR